MESVAYSSRWDTLLFGEYRRIPVQDLPIGAQEDQYRLIPRCAEIVNNPSEIRRAKTTLNGIAFKVEFHLVSEHTDPYTGLERDYLVQGETASQLFGDTIVWFGYELLAPLLDKRITISERMLCHFRIASTLLHEFTVSIIRMYIIFRYPSPV